jgi:hypothetical protein
MSRMWWTVIPLCCALGAGCSRSGKTVLGAPPSGKPQSVAAVRRAPRATLATLRGTMVEK